MDALALCIAEYLLWLLGIGGCKNDQIGLRLLAIANGWLRIVGKEQANIAGIYFGIDVGQYQTAGVDACRCHGRIRRRNQDGLDTAGDGGVFGRNRKVKNSERGKEAEGASRGMAPQESLWPLEGQVTSRFGWEALARCEAISLAELGDRLAEAAGLGTR